MLLQLAEIGSGQRCVCFMAITQIGLGGRKSEIY